MDAATRVVCTPSPDRPADSIKTLDPPPPATTNTARHESPFVDSPKLLQIRMADEEVEVEERRGGAAAARPVAPCFLFCAERSGEGVVRAGACV